MFETNARGILSSHYDHEIKDTAIEAVDFINTKMGGTEAGVAKITIDPTFASRVQLAYDHGKACGAFWFVAPRYWLENDDSMVAIDARTDDNHPILVAMRNELKNKAIQWLAFDVEEASLSTTKGQVTQTWMAFYVRDLVERIVRQQTKGNIRPFKMGVYSRRTFIDNPQNLQDALDIYLGVHPELFIYTTNWPNGIGKTDTLVNLLKIPVPATHAPRAFGYSADRLKTWQLWQAWGDNGQVYKAFDVVTNTGAARPVCIELFNGTNAELRAWAGLEGGTPPVPPVPPTPVPDDILKAIAAQTAKIDKIGKHFADYS